jgi:hypothetical protein
MYFNRIHGFYLGSDLWKEGLHQMTLDEQNDQTNEAITARITQLNDLLATAEKKFRDMKLPKDIWYRFDWSDHYGPGLVDYRAIGMDFRNGAFCLCFARGTDADIEEGEQYQSYSSRPYRECSMVERISIVENLEGLKQKIVEAKKEFVDEIETAIAKGTAFVAANEPKG